MSTLNLRGVLKFKPYNIGVILMNFLVIVYTVPNILKSHFLV